VEARISVNRLLASLILLPLLSAVACNKGEQAGNQALTEEVPRASADQPGVTPMAQRIAVLGLLNKRNGIVRDLTLKPGQAMRVKDVTVRLKACETSAPWEQEKLTGAFVQVDVRRPDGKWVRRFSGWLYKESPSLNVVEDPVYDVWPKSCAMSWPGGPPAPAAPGDSNRSSSASNEGGGSDSSELPIGNDASPATASPPPAEDNADVNNPT
jgi:hypothetical protein